MEDAEARGAWLRAQRRARGLSVAEFAERVGERLPDQRPDLDSLVTNVKRWERGRVLRISRRYRAAIAEVFGMTAGELFAARPMVPAVPAVRVGDVEGELEALELARRAAATDVGAETLARLEAVVDELAAKYARTPPGELLVPLRRHLGYVARLLEARKTLDEHRRLLVAGGWLSLLAATCHIDLHERRAAAARLRTAARLAGDAGHAEIAAWCHETAAWQAVTDGDHLRAVELSRAAQAIAPRGSSACVQAYAQEGRAQARLGAARETHALLDRVASLAADLPVPDRPEHHYRYDPAKAEAYAVTTLAWLGDPAAEPYARQVLNRLRAPSHGPVRPRRVATARLDLSLTLVAAGHPDEAARETLGALTSGALVPSNRWRAAEVIQAIAPAGLPEIPDLHVAYQALLYP